MKENQRFNICILQSKMYLKNDVRYEKTQIDNFTPVKPTLTRYQVPKGVCMFMRGSTA